MKPYSFLTEDNILIVVYANDVHIALVRAKAIIKQNVSIKELH